MEHVRALVIKFLMTLVVLGIVFAMLSDLTFAEMILLSLMVTALAYVLGDLLILPAWGNGWAVAADFALVLLSTWVVSRFLFGAGVIPWAYVVSAIVVAAGEYLFHLYLERTVLHLRRANV